MNAPSYTVTSITEDRRPNAFGASEPSWKVSMQHSTYADNYIDLRLPTEAEARRFTPWQLYEPKDILKNAGTATTQFVVEEVVKTKRMGQVNEYTGRADLKEVWKASLQSSDDARTMDWLFPSESEARTRFKEREAYTLVDMFGTLQSVPAVVSQAYQYAADQAAQRAKDLEEAQFQKNVKAEQAAIAKAASEGADVTKASAKAKSTAASYGAAQSKADAAKAKLDGKWWAGATPTQAEFAKHNADIAAANALEDAAYYAIQAAQVAAAQVAVEQQQYNLAVSAAKKAHQAVIQRTIPGDKSTYTITFGGASGYYNGVYYAAGTFHADQETFQWAGSYLPKGAPSSTVQAAAVQAFSFMK